MLTMQIRYQEFIISLGRAFKTSSYAKQKQPVAVKKGAAKQSRINAISEYYW